MLVLQRLFHMVRVRRRRKAEKEKSKGQRNVQRHQPESQSSLRNLSPLTRRRMAAAAKMVRAGWWWISGAVAVIWR